MKAITTTYKGPTSTKPARIIARAEGVKPLVMSYQEAERLAGDRGGPEDAHKAVAALFCRLMKWGGQILGGGLPSGDGYCWVFADNVNHPMLIDENMKLRARLEEAVGALEKVVEDTSYEEGECPAREILDMVGIRAAIAKAKGE